MIEIFPPDNENEQLSGAAAPWQETKTEEEEYLTGASADPIEEPEAPAGAHLLSPIEVRALACLIEKEKTVPGNYPPTLQSLTLACNQATSRDPVMRLEEGEVSAAARSLQQKNLVQQAPSTRAERYLHQAHRNYDLEPAALAVLCTLMLRGPQTVSEIFQRSKRMHPFADREEAESALELLMRRQPALACPHRSPGRGLRYRHCLASSDASLPPVAAAFRFPTDATPVGQEGVRFHLGANSPPLPVDAAHETASTAVPAGQPYTQPLPSADSRLVEAIEHMSQQLERLIDRFDRLEQRLEGGGRGQQADD